jgi:hypothetical protein
MTTAELFHILSCEFPDHQVGFLKEETFASVSVQMDESTISVQRCTQLPHPFGPIEVVVEDAWFVVRYRKGDLWSHLTGQAVEAQVLATSPDVPNVVRRLMTLTSTTPSKEG